MSESGASTSSAREVTDCNKLGILVEVADDVHSRERFSWGPNNAYKRHICKTAISGDWVKASSYDGTNPMWVRTPLTEDGDTALHIAVSMEQISFVEKLVERMSMQDIGILRADGNNAFCVAAISGNVEIARILLHKNPGLVWIRGHRDMLPIELAYLAGQPLMVKFLFGRILEDIHIKISFQDIVKLFFLALTNSTYFVASKLLKKYSELASAKNDKGLTALEVIAQLSFDRDAPGYQDILSLLFMLMEAEEFPNYARSLEAMFNAAKLGNDMILEFIFQYNPNLFMKVNSEGQSLLHVAILYRQETIYRLILSKGAYKNAIVQVVDHKGNNVLHLAGKLAAEERFGSPIHRALISSEEVWFKEVKKIVPPEFETMENAEGWTPQKLFYKEHKDLCEKAVFELYAIANNFLVVGTLIVTLGVTGALTIRTNTIEGKTPIFKQNTWYMIFLLSIAFGVSFTATSMLLFTSIILTSTWERKGGFVDSRQTRMTWGCLLLYAGVGIMVTISVISGVILVYTFVPTWTLLVIVALIVIPSMLSFVLYDFPSAAPVVRKIIFCKATRWECSKIRD